MSAVFEWRDAIRRPPAGRELKPTDRLVALVLSFYMDKDTLENARPGPARLAAETGLASRTVKLALQSLASSGWIVQTSQGGTRKGGTEKVASTYRGVLPTGDERAPVQEMHGSTRAGDSRVPVHLTTDTRAGDAPHLVQDLAQDLGGADLVGLAAALCSRPADLPTRMGEAKVQLARFRHSHSDEDVLEALKRFESEGYRFGFARELVPMLEGALTDAVSAHPERRAGYVPGHQPNPGYMRRHEPAFELDEHGNAVRIA